MSWDHDHQELNVPCCQGGMGPCLERGFHVTACASRTMYHWDGKGENPNADVWLCPACEEEYNAHWDDMWSQTENYN